MSTKNKLPKRLMSILLIAVLVLGIIPMIEAPTEAATSQADDIVKEAISYEGLKLEAVKSKMKSKYGSYYRVSDNGGEGYKGDWCAWFVSACAQNMKMTNIIGQGTTVDALVTNTYNKGATITFVDYTWYNTKKSTYGSSRVNYNTSYKPRKGDFVITKNTKSNVWYAHVGIVAENSNTTYSVKVVDGNGGLDPWYVTKVSYPKTISSSIVCYVTPKYSSTPAQKTFTIRYNANGGSGSMNNQVITYGKSTATTPNKFTAPGYTFQYWMVCAKNSFYGNGQEWRARYISPDGSQNGWYVRGYEPDGWTFFPYANGGSVSATSDIDKSTVDFYAAWAPISPKLVGYTNTSGKNYIKGTDFKSESNLSVWSRNTNASNVYIDSNETYGRYNSLRIVNSEAGTWQGNKDLGIQTDTNGNVFNDECVGDKKQMVLSFYAKASTPGTSIYFRWGYEPTTMYKAVALSNTWTKYVIRMDKHSTDCGSNLHPYIDKAGTVWLSQLQLEDGTVATEFVPEEGGQTVENNHVNGRYTLPKEPAREGYVFDGWYTSKTGGEKITESSAMRKYHMAVYAHWKTIYKIRYDANGGTGSMSDQQIIYGTKPLPSLKRNTFTRTGYEFDDWYAYRVSDNKWYYGNADHSKGGWYVEGSQPSDHKKYKWIDGQNISAVDSTVSGDTIVLYAQWRQVAHTHTWSSSKTTKQPTCTESGVRTYYCKENSSHTKTESIPATGHKYGDWEYLNANMHQRVCDNAPSHVETQNHTWDNGKITKNPTETASGVKTYTCTVCNGTMTEKIDPLIHEHTLVKTNAKPATCTTSGNRAYWTCSSCGKVFSNSAETNEVTVSAMKIPALGHDYGNWTYINKNQHERVCENDSSHVETQNHTWDNGKTTKSPTETASGVKTYTCIVCNGTKTESITPTPHEHTLVKTSAKSATCTSSGTRAYWTCSSCGKVFSDSAGTNETTVASMKVPSYGHSYGEWEYINASQHERVCDNDSTHIETGNHSWNSGRVTREATETQTGIRAYTCTVCGGTKTEPIPKPALTKKATIRRLYGDDRYATALKIADAYKGDTKQSKLDYIIVACGTNFPDALAASYLANKRNAPVIVWREKDNAKVQAYIKNNVKKGGMVYLLGGPTIVGKSIANGMKNYKFVRLYDADRYGTNIKILRKAGLRSGEILVCDGTNFQNALIASATGKPILLVKPNGLTRDQRSYLASLGTIRFTIIGDTSSVSEEVSKQLSVFGSVSRINGSTPDEVSSNVARRYYSDPTEITLAIDNNFPDGLCGGPLAIAGMGPIFLVSDGSYVSTKNYCNSLNLKRANVLGGSTLVSDETVKRIAGM